MKVDIYTFTYIHKRWIYIYICIWKTSKRLSFSSFSYDTAHKTETSGSTSVICRVVVFSSFTTGKLVSKK